MEIKHDDFGEKIGGAKKELWRQRGLTLDDLSEMNAKELDTYVKKDYVWRKPNYEALIESGIPYEVAYFIKTIRDNIPTAPKYPARQREYVETVQQIKDVIESIKTKEDVFSAYSKCLIDKGYIHDDGHTIRYTPKWHDNSVLTRDLAVALRIDSEVKYAALKRSADKAQFGVSKEQRVPRGYDIQFNDGKHVYSSKNDWLPNTYYVVKGYRILQQNFTEYGDALKWVQDFAQKGRSASKQRFVPEQLQHIRRDGQDYRNGNHVTGQDYIDTFGFRGGEFGNWMSQQDRQVSLDFGFDALKDLACALKVADKDISFAGELSIAFGARGSGKAVAHYEPLRNVINLTKMHGAGSLAHEWFHGLDDYLGQVMGAKGALTESGKMYEPFNKLLDTMKYRLETPEEAAKRLRAAHDKLAVGVASYLQERVFPLLPDDAETMNQYQKVSASFLKGDEESLTKLNELTGGAIPQEQIALLKGWGSRLCRFTYNIPPVPMRIKTDFFRNSEKMGQLCAKERNYWDSNEEMAARAFATYIISKLPGHSDYLNGHAECAVTIDPDTMNLVFAFPRGEEREAIDMAFDEIFRDLKERGIFTHEEKANEKVLSTTYELLDSPVKQQAAAR